MNISTQNIQKKPSKFVYNPHLWAQTCAVGPGILTGNWHFALFGNLKFQTMI